MQFERYSLSDERLIEIYRSMLLPRMIEEKMLVLLRQGKVSKWFSGIGQEAIAVGATLAMQPDEWIMPLHRNLGVFTTRKIPFRDLINQWQGQPDGFSKGRERSFHFGTRQYNICGMISHLGPQLSVADGAALAYKLKGEKKASLAFSGEGGTSEGEFHEALNVASVWNLPVIFILENNGYGLSTPVREQFRCEGLVDKAKGYGMEGVQIDGNNILTVLDTVAGVRDYCIREQRPYLIECMTFRMRGHEEASGTKYVPKELFEQWMEKDPIRNYEHYLTSENILSNKGLADIKEEFKNYIESEIQQSSLSHTGAGIHIHSEEKELADIYAPVPTTILKDIDNGRTEPLRFVDAIKEGLYQSMEAHDNLVLMGQDIAEYGGVFKITEGFVEKFGKARVRNTPLCESAIVGTGLGLSLEGFKSMVEMQFADFVSVGFNQIVNNLAKIHYRWGQQADVVVRMPTGAGVGAGPFHSQSNEAWFTHVPGLKVVYPSSPEDAKGLIIASINDPNPVMYFEHKHLYRSISGAVPSHYYETPIGLARKVRSGTDVSIITYGMGVIWATQYAAAHPDISPDILDLRTLVPLDYKAIRETVRNTGKVLVLHEDTMTGGFGGEIAAWIAQNCFEYLDAPVMRCASLDTPVPFNRELEDQFLAQSRLDATLEKLMNY
ncbi:MAG: dehydrogenase [Chitinophagaceae bacterium]|nr:dehydrogenase [Chitinophagaceae bacterium]MCW5915260.1 dehydrogenase E1 component subunit alpha/beta [Chitinophagaceae bacterium]MCZ2396403.1 dehydrogenase E1 component subunit alpha/beta [Chitinophagales bacterium]